MKGARYWLIGLGLLLAGMIVGVILVQAAFQRYLRSEGFRELVSEKTSGALKVNGQFAPLQWEGASVYSEQFNAVGQSDTRLARLQADRIRAVFNLRAALDGVWRVDRVDIARLDIVPGIPPKPAEARMDSFAFQIPAWLPQRFEMGEVAIADVNLGAGSGASLKHSAWLVTPSGEGWQVDAKGGKLAMAGIPALDLENARARYQDRTWFLTDAALRDRGEGVFKLTGEWDPGADLALRVDWQRVAIAEWIPEKWRKHLKGMVAGSATLTGPAEVPTSWKVAGDFHLTEGQLQEIDVLDQIAQFTQAPQFRRMPLNTVAGKFVWEDGSLTVKEFIGESRGLLRLEGDFAIDANGGIQGEFQVGITSQSLQWMPGSRERVFTVSRNGYLWAPMKVSGTLDAPTEDLSARLIAAMPAELIERGTDAIRQAPENLREAAKGVLDMLLR